MAEITVSVPNSTFTITKPNSSFTVTTPTAHTIAIGNPSSTIDITNSPVAITVAQVGITNTDQLIEGANNLFYTNARADARVALGIAAINYPVDSVNGQTNTVVLDTDDVDEGTTNLYYTTARANNDFDTRLATKTTTNLAEGTNLYYTTARSNSDFDTRLATKSTDNLNEGSTNQYFTNARARAAISAVDGGGDGSLSYDNSTGVITYTGPSASEVRAHFTGGTGVTITNGSIAIGQPVATTSDVQFASMNIDGIAVYDTATLTTSATTADQIVDAWSASTYRSAKYQIQITSGTDYEVMEILVLHDGTTATQVIYADVYTNNQLATFSVDINAGSVRLLTTPTNAVTAYKVVKTAITA